LASIIDKRPVAIFACGEIGNQTYEPAAEQGELLMAARNGEEFIESLRRAPREVWISGRRVGDITTDPVFRRPIQSIAQLYDLQTQPEHREVMTYAGDGGPCGSSFMIPRTRADLVKRRQSMKVWADATFGMVGRSPDYLNTVLMTWAEGADFFGQRGEQFAHNVRNYYDYCRDRDLFLTHAIVNPQSDRSKGSHQQDNAFVHLGVVEETPDGLIVRGAKMLATHGPTADELLIYPLPGVREGEERYVLAFGIPTSTPGLRFICREPFDTGDQSQWDHPLGARFEEPDAVCVFDDVLIPWDRVFLYNDVKMGNALHVQEQLGELLGYLQLIEAAILMAEDKAEPTGRGALRPAYAPLQALRYHLPKMYERMVQVTQVLSAGGLLINPTEADLHSEIGPDIERYYRGAGVDADKRIQLSKLAWDATGTQFGQRMLQYERYYAGDPVRVGASYYLDHDVAPLLAQVQRALRGS
jgi:aromatic ring hydroxylase